MVCVCLGSEDRSWARGSVGWPGRLRIGGGHAGSDVVAPCCQPFLKFCRDAGFPGGAVPCFARIRGEVEELAAMILEMFNEFPTTGAQGSARGCGWGVVVMGKVEEQGIARQGCGWMAEERREVEGIAGVVVRDREAGGGEQGWEKVGELDGFIATRGGVDAAGPMDEQWHAETALVEGSLARAERGIGGDRDVPS